MKVATLMAALAMVTPVEFEFEGDEVFTPRLPKDDEERDAVRGSGRDLCPVRHGAGFRCTRTLGHRGDHVCGDNQGERTVLARWNGRM